MPITSTDVQDAISAGLTRRMSYTTIQPSGGVDGDWAIPGPVTAPGIYRRVSGVWVPLVRELLGTEIVARLMALAGTDRLDASAIRNLPSSAGIQFVSLGAVNVTFANRTWQIHGGVIPAAATLIQVVSTLPRIRGSWIRQAELWRNNVSLASSGDAATEANRLILQNYGAIGNLSIGRRSGNSVLVQYDGGYAGLATASIEVFTA